MTERDNENKMLAPIDEDIREEFYKDNTEEEDDAVNDEYYTLPREGKRRTRLPSVLSLVLGILSVALAAIYPASLATAGAAIVFSAVSRVKLGFFNRLSLVGLILGIVGAVFGISSMIVTLLGLL